MELVESEMDWTVNCFWYHEKVWKKRAEEAQGTGHRAYAWKQKSSWEGWAKTAENAFKELKNS
jgi:hypothetical protein